MGKGSRRPTTWRRKLRYAGAIGAGLFWLTMTAGCGGGGSSGEPPNAAPGFPRVNAAPVFKSGHTITAPDDTTAVMTVAAVDPDGDPITYSLAGGVDADRFDLDPKTGELRFKQPADFEAAMDSNRNNVYAVAVAAFDGVKTTWQALEVSVTGLALTVEIKPGLIKTLSFQWTPLEGATHYKLFVNPDGESGYTPVGSDITATHVNVTIPVHLTDWVNCRYLVEGYNERGLIVRSDAKEIRSLMLGSIGYIKASNTDEDDLFGDIEALSADGQTLVVAVPREASAATGVNGDQKDNSAINAGAVYVYTRAGSVWTQQAYIKASNTDGGDFFGSSVALSADGQTLVVGAHRERSAATGVNGDQNDNSAEEAGAVYVYTRSGSGWTQQAYIKASNAGGWDLFGSSVALSADGLTFAVGARGEDSSATGVNGDQTDNSDASAGAVYVYTRSGSEWTQQAYIKASNTEGVDYFGSSVALSADGRTLVVGALREDSAATGVNGNQNDNSASGAGAVYIYTRSGSDWTHQAYVKASNTKAESEFGSSVVLSADGRTLAVAALGSNTVAVAHPAGAVYVYTRTGAVWTHQEYISASDTGTEDTFGSSVALSANGETLVVGAYGEGSAATGVNGDQRGNSVPDAGAVYVYKRSGSDWTQQAYVKASNTARMDYFGSSVALSADGQTMAVGASGEDSVVTGVNGDQSDNTSPQSGAIYLY